MYVAHFLIWSFGFFEFSFWQQIHVPWGLGSFKDTQIFLLFRFLKVGMVWYDHPGQNKKAIKFEEYIGPCKLWFSMVNKENHLSFFDEKVLWKLWWSESDFYVKFKERPLLNFKWGGIEELKQSLCRMMRIF